jgi:hypothetical protein
MLLQRLYFLAPPWRCGALPEPEQPPRQPATPPPSSSSPVRRRARRRPRPRPGRPRPDPRHQAGSHSLGAGGSRRRPGPAAAPPGWSNTGGSWWRRAAEAKHVRPLRQPQPVKRWPGGQLKAGPDELGHMGRHLQAFKLNLTYTVIEGNAQGLGGLRRVLGHIACHLLGGQLPLVADLGDVAHVELLTPPSDQGHALVLVQGWAGHGRRRPGPTHSAL